MKVMKLLIFFPNRVSIAMTNRRGPEERNWLGGSNLADKARISVSCEPAGLHLPNSNRLRRSEFWNRCIERFPNFDAGRSVLVAGSAALSFGGLHFVSSAEAFEFRIGSLAGSLDTTISYGVTYRVEKHNADLAADINGNDGNLNYGRGLVSNTSKFTSDLELSFGDFGAFVRATGYMDFENRDGFHRRTTKDPEALIGVGKGAEILDAYLTASFESEGRYLDFRVGKHVLNWGESTFIPNGINEINHYDVGKLRLPGSELREALLPVSMISASFSPNDIWTYEGFYQLDWQNTQIDPVGSYFSSTDYVGLGARKAVIPGIGQSDDLGYGFGPLTHAINADLANFRAVNPQSGMLVRAPQPRQLYFDSDFASIHRGSDRTPGDDGQFGFAVRYLAEDFNDTEFGFYFVNYHSRLPVVSGETGSRLGIQAGLAAANAVSSSGSETGQAVLAAVRAQFAAAGVPAPDSVAMQAASTQVSGVAQAMAIDRYAKTSNYFLEYPENIKLFGLSFNSVIGNSGWALQGEYSQRQGVPLQRAERSVVGEGLVPIITALTLANTNPAHLPTYLANYKPQKVEGYFEADVSQIQFTATKYFGPAFGADGIVFLTEGAFMHVHDMPDRLTNPLESPAGGVLSVEATDATKSSWGYRIAARLDYLNAIGTINLYPYTQFQHDVDGNSPTPIGPFVKGRTALTLGLRADYSNRWQADLGYTRYAGDANELSDRDFIYASMNYSF